MYKKAVYDAFSPTFNGESSRFFRNVNFKTLFYENGKINFDTVINNYRDYVKRRSFKYFREKDENGQYKNLKEAAIGYRNRGREDIRNDGQGTSGKKTGSCHYEYPEAPAGKSNG